MEGLVRNIGNFARFLEAISFSHGAVLKRYLLNFRNYFEPIDKIEDSDIRLHRNRRGGQLWL